MKLLTRIANLCETDKGTVVGEGHGYTEFYEDFFRKYNGKNINILEIGVFNGGSLKMYNTYFDEKCTIYALDIENKEEYNTENIKTFICNQGKREDLEEFKKTIGNIKFDIIIDDGSHLPWDQMLSFYYLHDLLKEDGLYIIEDLHSWSWNDMENSTLYSLMFTKPFVFLSAEESEILHSRINTVQIWLKNNDRAISNPQKTSITSVITMKQS